MKILKAEATSPTIVEGKLEVEGLVNKTLSKLGSLRIEQSALWKQLEIKRSMLEEKMEWVMLAETLLANIELNSLKLDDAITKVKWEFFVLEVEEKII